MKFAGAILSTTVLILLLTACSGSGGGGEDGSGTGNIDVNGNADNGNGSTDDGSGGTDNGTDGTDNGTGSTDNGTGSTDNGNGSTDNGNGGTTNGVATRPHNSSCVALALSTPAATSAITAFSALHFDSTITGIYQPPADDSHWYVTTQAGVLATFDNDDAVAAYTRVSGVPTVNDRGEGGLLSMAFHPLFATNRQVFLSYTTDTSEHSMVSRVTRYTLTTDNRLTDAVVFIEVVQPATNHNGGNIAFGPDGYLYVGFGDGGGADDQFGSGQNPATWLSKMLRINVDQPDVGAGTPYSIPTENPFINRTGYKPEIFAQGFRNPWKWSFDRVTSQIIAADVGQNLYEEVDVVEPGKNYGWPITEGLHCFNADSCNKNRLADPIFEYSHDDGGCSITGGFVYRGSAIPALYGKYLYGDYCASGVKGFAIDDPQQTQLIVAASPGGITTFGQANNGEILVGTANGELYRIVNNNAPTMTIPQTLSTHPCIADAATQQLSEGVIPYDVNSPLWSDGADKSRFIALPDDKTIHVADDGDFSFPVGSVLIKQFSHAGKPVETRFLMHHDSGWAGYSYEWNAEGTDATLSTTAHTKTIDSGYTHIFPSSAQCFQCHTDATHVALGLETAQLNRNFTYVSTDTNTSITANQLDAWQHIGLFDAALSTTNRNRSMPALDDTSASVEQRARAYLHSNCSGCHRPGGYPDYFDLRFDTPLASTGICNVAPAAGDLGISGAKLLAPGNAELSVIFQRMNRRDAKQMPPLATGVVDAAAVEVVGEWINGLSGCPVSASSGAGVELINVYIQGGITNSGVTTTGLNTD